MRTEKTLFTNHEGARLSARLDLPVGGPPAAYALFAHCFTCGKDLSVIRRISEALTSRGIAVFRFDFTGLGESDGDFADTSFSSNVEDLVAAADFLRTNHEAPQLLVGHSLGGAAVLMAASHIEECSAVVTIGAPSEPSHVKKHLACSLEEIEERGVADVKIAGRTFQVKKQFLDDLDEAASKERIAALGRALLILHSPVDEVVGIDNASEIFTAARHPKSFVSLEGADHLLTRAKDATFAGDVLAAWAIPHLSLRPPESPLEGERVFVRTERSYHTHVRTERHTFELDEPKELGGTDRGDNPYAHLLAALGACTSITLRMYADRKEWPLAAINVRLSHQKVHAKDCAECETEEGKVDVIERVVELEGPLSEEQMKRLEEIAHKCPVHTTLTSENVIRTELRGGGISGIPAKGE
jgi:putative redox protein